MKLEIDDEVMDGLIIASLTESIGYLENEIKRIKKIKKLKDHQQFDLADAVIHLDALKRTRYYYGGVKYAHD